MDRYSETSGSNTDSVRRRTEYSISIAGKYGYGEAKAEFKSSVERYAERVRSTRDSVRVTNQQDYKVTIPPYSAVVIRETFADVVETRVVKATIVTDVLLVGTRRSRKLALGDWNLYIPAERRTLPVETTVTFAGQETSYYTDEVIFPDSQSCEQAYVESGGFELPPQNIPANAGVGALNAGEMARSVLSTMSGAVDSNSAADVLDTLTFSPVAINRPDCTGNVGGDGDLRGEDVAVDFSVSLDSCEGMSSGKIEYTIRGRDAENREVRGENYATIWNGRRGREFDHSDVARAPNTMVELLEISDERIIECSCDAD